VILVSALAMLGASVHFFAQQEYFLISIGRYLMKACYGTPNPYQPKYNHYVRLHRNKYEQRRH
jgi:hypothetical protein